MSLDIILTTLFIQDLSVNLNNLIYMIESKFKYIYIYFLN